MYRQLTCCCLLVISTATLWSLSWSLPWSSHDNDDKYWSNDKKSMQSYFNSASFPKTVKFDHSVFDDSKVIKNNAANDDSDDERLIRHHDNIDAEDIVDDDSKLLPNIEDDHNDDDDIIEPVLNSAEDDVAFDVDTEIWKSDEHAADKLYHTADTGADTDTDHKCDKCPPGYGFIRMCNATHGTVCEPCEYRRSYSDHVPHFKPCSSCSKCGTGMFEDYPCTPQTDTFCDSCAERKRWPATDDIWQNDDYVKKCGGSDAGADAGETGGRFDAAADQFASREDSAELPDTNNILINRIVKVPIPTALENDSPEISSEEKDHNKHQSIDDDINDESEREPKTGLSAKEEEEQLDRLYKSVGEELKELESQEAKREKQEPTSSDSGEDLLQLKNAKKLDHALKNSDSGPEIVNVKKSDSGALFPSSESDNDNNGFLTGVVQETIAIVETKYSVDEQSSTVTAASADALPIGATTKISRYPAIKPINNLKINRAKDETYVKNMYAEITATKEAELNMKREEENANKIIYKPSAHNYPYNELIHAHDEFRMKQIKKAVMLYSITAVILLICIILFVFYSKMLCSRRRLFIGSAKMPSNLTDQDDRIITECARIMAEKEAPKKRPSLFESSSKSSEESLNVMENPLVEYLDEDCRPSEQIHSTSASTESLIPATDKQQKRSKNDAVIV